MGWNISPTSRWYSTPMWTHDIRPRGTILSAAVTATCLSSAICSHLDIAGYKRRARAPSILQVKSLSWIPGALNLARTVERGTKKLWYLRTLLLQIAVVGVTSCVWGRGSKRLSNRHLSPNPCVQRACRCPGSSHFELLLASVDVQNFRDFQVEY